MFMSSKEVVNSCPDSNFRVD